MKKVLFAASGLIGLTMLGSPVALAQNCERIVSKVGLSSPNCNPATPIVGVAQPSIVGATTTVPVVIAGSGTGGAQPVTAGGALPGQIPGLQPIGSQMSGTTVSGGDQAGPNASQALPPLQPISSSVADLNTLPDVPDIAPITQEPVGESNTTRDYLWAGIGGGAGVLGQSYSYNGIGGSDYDEAGTDPKTFGNSLEMDEILWGVNAAFGGKFGSVFTRGTGFYGFGEYTWADPKTTVAAIDGSSVTIGSAFDVKAEATLARGQITAGYSFDLGDGGVSVDIGPTAFFSNSTVKTSIDGTSTDVEETASVNTNAFGASLGLSVAPDFEQRVNFWGHAAVHGMYAMNSFSVSQKFTTSGGAETSLTEADRADSTGDVETKFVYGGELAANVGFRVSDTVSIGAGAYANYFSDLAVLNDYKLETTTFADFGLRASLAVRF